MCIFASNIWSGGGREGGREGRGGGEGGKSVIDAGYEGPGGRGREKETKREGEINGRQSKAKGEREEGKSEGKEKRGRRR